MTSAAKAVVTIAVGNEYSKMAELTHPPMQKYAERIGAEFIVIDSFDRSSQTPHFAKFRLYDLLDAYQRILYIDTDALMTPNCPDLFQLVPENQLGVFLEEDEAEPTRRTLEVQKICGKVDGWTGKYFNSGVMVLSSSHRAMFSPGFQQNSLPIEYEQAQLNWNAQKLGIPIFNIGRRFNHIVWELDASRYSSFIIHYVFCCPPKWVSRRQKIFQDAFILSARQPLQRLLIALRCGRDAMITKMLESTLWIRKPLGLHNKSAG